MGIREEDIGLINKYRDSDIPFIHLNDNEPYFTKKEIDAARKKADVLSKKALWTEFIKYYYDAYDIALVKAEERKCREAQ